jgi:hypothetical protein
MIGLTALTEAMYVVPKTEGELSVIFERRSMQHKQGDDTVTLPDPDWSDVTIIYGKKKRTFEVFQEDCQAAYDYLLSVSGIAS